MFFDQMKQHAATVRKYGTKPVFFMSWAYADVPAMTAQLADAYTTAANDNDAFVIPAGLAFAKAIERRPALNLYVADKRHPSLAGTYLAAAHHLWRAVPEIAGRIEIHGRPQPGDRGIPADRGMADVAAIFPAAQRVGKELIFQRMRKHLAHDGGQRLARQRINRDPARAVRRAGVARQLGRVDDKLQREMREHVRDHARQAPPSRRCA